jgi:class 3 adenylate cyclase
MFVADSPFVAANIGVSLAEAYADDEMLTDVRVGISYGSVLVHEGDYFGSVVNMASRIVETTSPGTVTVSSDLARALTTDPEFNSSDMVIRQVRPRNLKGIGRTSLWVLSRHGAEPLTFDRWLAARFEKLADVGHNIDELRERGEQLLARGRREPLSSLSEHDSNDTEWS